MKASHLSPTNLSRDSGLYSSDNQLYEDSTAESEPTSQMTQKQLVTRSISQIEESSPKQDSAEVMSRSYDGVMDSVGIAAPVPPPRRHKHVIRPEGMELPRKVVPVNAMRPTSSAVNMADVRRNKYFGHSSKRVSNDSLGSLEEYSETSEGGNCQEDFHHLQNKPGDIGILRKSESGARLYINEDLIHSARGDGKGMDQLMTPPDNHSNIKRTDVIPPPSMSPPSSIRSWGDFQNMPPVDFSASYSGHKISPKQVSPMNLSASYGGSSLRPHFSTTSEESPDTEDFKEKDFKIEGDEVKQEPVHASVLEKDTEQAGASRPKPPETVAIIQVPHGLITHQYMQMAEDLRKRQSRAGMTSKGSDIFPTRIFKERPEDEMRQSYDSAISRMTPVTTAASADRSQSFNKMDIPRSAQLLKQLNLTKSASDTRVPRSLLRPDKPPTYQEALKRKSLLSGGAAGGQAGNALYQISEQDALKEKVSTALFHFASIDNNV